MAELPALVKRSPLLTALVEAAQRHGHAESAAGDIADWVLRYILFHGKRHPQEMGRGEIAHYLEHVAATDKNALRTIEAARSALEFLYRVYLQRDIGEMPRPRPPRLLDQVRQVLRVKHYALRTEECYTQWIKRFIGFHGMRHPRDMGAAELQLFLTDLAVHGHVSASTQNQALNAIVFLYRDVLEIELGSIDAVRARRPKRLPVVLAAEEVAKVLALVEGADGVIGLMARLLYGCGLRLMECCRGARGHSGFFFSKTGCPPPFLEELVFAGGLGHGDSIPAELLRSALYPGGRLGTPAELLPARLRFGLTGHGQARQPVAALDMGQARALAAD